MFSVKEKMRNLLSTKQKGRTRFLRERKGERAVCEREAETQCFLLERNGETRSTRGSGRTCFLRQRKGENMFSAKEREREREREREGARERDI